MNKSSEKITELRNNLSANKSAVCSKSEYRREVMGMFSSQIIDEYKAYKEQRDILDKRFAEEKEELFKGGEETREKLYDYEWMTVDEYAVEIGEKSVNFKGLSAEAKALANCLYVCDLMPEDKPVNRVEADFLMKQIKDDTLRHPLFSTTPGELFNNKIFSAKHIATHDVKYEQYLKYAHRKADVENDMTRSGKPKHRSLTGLFKHSFCDKYTEIEKILRNTDVNRNVGSLPKPWLEQIKSIPGASIRQKTAEVFAAFAEFADATHSAKNVDKEFLLAPQQRLSEKLSKIMQSDIAVEFLDSGYHSKVFKISGAGQDCVLKTDHSNAIITPNMGNHGATKEVAMGLFVSASNDAPYYVETYMGRVGTIYSKDNFGLYEYVAPEAESKRPVKAFQVKSYDFCKENLRGGKIADFGDLRIDEPLRDRMVYKLARALKKGGLKNEKNFAKVRDFAQRHHWLRQFETAVEYYNSPNSKISFVPNFRGYYRGGR